MIYGNVNNEFFEQQKAVLPAPIRAAVSFLKENDMVSHEPGRFDIELDGVPMILQVIDMTTAARETKRPEIHRKYIDVQFLAGGGPEMAEFDNDDHSYAVNEDLLSSDRDILFYDQKSENAGGTIKLTPGTYVVYFPWDIHVPGVAFNGHESAIRKIVIKVPMESCL